MVKVAGTLSISSDAGDGYQVIAVDGELDELMAAELDAAIDGCRGRSVIVELSDMVFVSSAGIHALLRDRRGKVVLVCPPGNVMRLFDVVRTNNRVSRFEDLATAILGSAAELDYEPRVAVEA
jgi:anti-anti-sigma factor